LSLACSSFVRYNPGVDRALPILKGHGTTLNPTNRFETIHVENDFQHFEGDSDRLAEFSKVKTEYLVDASRSVIASNNSPDIGFTHSINPYRGCSHGCVYCYARPNHEFLGLSAGIDFETKIFVKPKAADLLRAELSAKSWNPTVVAISGVTDAYQPVERKLQITRGCLRVLNEFRNPVAIVTKNQLIARDADVLAEMAAWNGVHVYISVTTLDPRLTAIMEPRTSTPTNRLKAIETLAKAGVPVAVLMAPIIPGLTDHEIPAVVKAAVDAGARRVGYVPLRLPGAVSPIFQDWLEQHFPDRKQKVLNRIRDMRGGKLNDSRWGHRFRGDGIWADQIKAMMQSARRRAGIEDGKMPKLSVDHFRRPSGPQMSLWDV
jgi:DNA repair photolyase